MTDKEEEKIPPMPDGLVQLMFRILNAESKEEMVKIIDEEKKKLDEKKEKGDKR